MRVGQRPDDRRLDPLVLRDGLGEGGARRGRHLPVVALPERGRVGLGLRDCGVDAGSSIPSKRSDRSHATSSAPVTSVVAMRRAISRPSWSSARVTGARHANRSQTYTARLPRRGPSPRGAGRPRTGRPRRPSRSEARERRPRDLGADVADDRDLPRRREMQVERAERPGERARHTFHRGREQAENALAARIRSSSPQIRPSRRE